MLPYACNLKQTLSSDKYRLVAKLCSVYGIQTGNLFIHAHVLRATSILRGNPYFKVTQYFFHRDVNIPKWTYFCFDIKGRQGAHSAWKTVGAGSIFPAYKIRSTSVSNRITGWIFPVFLTVRRRQGVGTERKRMRLNLESRAFFRRKVASSPPWDEPLNKELRRITPTGVRLIIHPKTAKRWNVAVDSFGINGLLIGNCSGILFWATER